MSKSREILAAIDLGSNSFHMLLARLENEQLQVVDRHKEMVRLAGGLDKDRRLTREVRDRALACLQRFAQLIKDLPAENIRVVGTNTLRSATNSNKFLVEAERALGHDIEIVSGMEEARLVYLGVAHSTPSEQGKRLVIDIGGGSTELIIGEGFETLLRESLNMGCVSITRQYFSNGMITEAAWESAVTHAKLELLPLIRPYSELGWEVAIGASGTMRSMADVQREMGWAEEGITRDGMHKIKKALLKIEDIEAVKFEGLSAERQPVFVGGAAIVKALFEGLQLELMQPAQGALREGLLYDLSGRRDHEDVRGRTIDFLLQRFHIDPSQAQRVMQVGVRLIEAGAETLELDDEDIQLFLWAAELHEIGLAVAHSHYNRHGAYLIEHADLPGFSLSEQRLLAVLIRLQRRKISKRLFNELPEEDLPLIKKILVLLRVALILRRDRNDAQVPLERVKWSEKGLSLKFTNEWLKSNPLTRADLEQEAGYLKSIDLRLRVGCVSS
jgi:exopolyphosphatase/guanosine-5'-triphosphate,3'-diphosphate pyrophosphatase